MTVSPYSDDSQNQESESVRTERLEDWCEELVGHIGRRAAITYAINEILKTNTKTVFTVAAVDYLKKEQARCNQGITTVVRRLISGERS